MDSIIIPRFFREQIKNQQMPPKAPLADQGWCSAQRIQILMTAGGSHTIVYAVMAVPRKAMTEGIRTAVFPGILNNRTFTIPQSQPSVRRL